MGILKNLFGPKNSSCCDIKIQEVKPEGQVLQGQVLQGQVLQGGNANVSSCCGGNTTSGLKK